MLSVANLFKRKNLRKVAVSDISFTFKVSLVCNSKKHQEIYLPRCFPLAFFFFIITEFRGIENQVLTNPLIYWKLRNY